MKRSFAYFTIAVFGIIVAASSHANQTNDCHGWLQRFADSTEWRERGRMLMRFADCKAHWSQEEIQSAQTLFLRVFNQELENQILQREERTEGQGEYLIELIDVTIDLLHGDPRLAEPIIRRFSTGGGRKPTEALASLGDKAIPAMVEIYSVTQPFSVETPHDKEFTNNIRWNILRTFELMIKERRLSPEAIQEAVKPISLKALQDENDFIRSRAIHVWAELGDASVIPLLEEIARDDSFKVIKEVDSVKRTVYPNRELAQEVLQKLRARQ